MTILIDKETNKFKGASSGGFPPGALDNHPDLMAIEYSGAVPEIDEEKGESIIWDDTKKELIKAV